MNNRPLLISIFGLFIILNLIPSYLWLWGIPFVNLERPEYSYIEVSARDILTFIQRTFIIAGLWIPFVIVIWKRNWNLKALVMPTLASIALFLAMVISHDYPNSESEYTEDGYQHRIEKWTESNRTTIKHWKSQDSLKNYLSRRHINWKLISEEIKN
jgi:hypothetical protein